MRLSKAAVSGGILALSSVFRPAAHGESPSASVKPVTDRPTVAAASGPAVREIRSPRTSVTPTPVPLGSLARRKVAPDSDLVTAASAPRANEFSTYGSSVEELAGLLVVTGRVRNLGREASSPRVVVEGRRFDGSPVMAYATLSPSGPIPSFGDAEYTARLPEAQRSTLRVRVLSGPTTGGEIGSASGRRLAECLSFRATIPEGPGLWSFLVDVEIRNHCAEPVPAARAEFVLAVRDVGGGRRQPGHGKSGRPRSSRRRRQRHGRHAGTPKRPRRGDERGSPLKGATIPDLP